MAKRNVTVQLDEEVITQVRVIAARQGTSISALLARQLRELAQDVDRYEYARERALQAMAEAGGHGGIRWRREDLYDRGERANP
ncbi:ribbon-helix-helix protein, CopG family [Nocardia sp. XZ_19_385]|uniref:ribbon-helix-helix protein, CopG family n=1 Tax=Nocardia sp. XZ_19_385 TaxID=2769488 RepID=UPI00188F1477|nr:ribbon-helix-helix protein, CopG family [Nocardia sp. XZ_19_385]